MSSPNPRKNERPTVPLAVQLLAYLLLSGLLVWGELPSWLSPESRIERLNGWLSGADPGWLPFVPFLILFPLCWWGSKGRTRSRLGWLFDIFKSSPREPQPRLLVAWLLAGIVFAVAFGMSYRTGLQFEDLPPAYHDEYSYLLQAETFAAGRWSYPSFEQHSELFDQMHVLNNGQFASRYFPGTGAWIAPFVLLGHPWLGHQLAQALSAMLVFWIGRELSNAGTGFLAGLLYAFSPGLILFSNLLLGHHPTLVGLMFFQWAFLRMMRSPSIIAASCAGCGLSFAMLCRPMTAASVALPCGIAFAWWWIKGRWRLRKDNTVPLSTSLKWRTVVVAGMGVPLVAGFTVLFVQNFEITGDPLKSPYQLYNDVYTPRHVYGFNNAIRGERETGPLVSDQYDRWARNLTPQLAVENMQSRWVNSLRWTLGIVPLTIGGFLCLATPFSGDRRWWLIITSILSLHLAHIPYWFSGIMGWHYVFESAPLWLLLFAEATRRLLAQWESTGRKMMARCWVLMIGVAVVVNLWTVQPLWPAKLDRGTIEIKYPRQLYGRFRAEIDRLRHNHDAIVFVLPDRADISMDYVTNPATLNGPVLIARLADRELLPQDIALFPTRVILLFDAKSKELEIVRSPVK